MVLLTMLLRFGQEWSRQTRRHLAGLVNSKGRGGFSWKGWGRECLIFLEWFALAWTAIAVSSASGCDYSEERSYRLASFPLLLIPILTNMNVDAKGTAFISYIGKVVVTIENLLWEMMGVCHTLQKAIQVTIVVPWVFQTRLLFNSLTRRFRAFPITIWFQIKLMM